MASSLLLAAQVQSVHGAAEVFGSTAAALRGLAGLLSDGRDRIRALAREVRAAREAAEHARGLADAAGRRMAAQPGSTGLEPALLHLSAASYPEPGHYPIAGGLATDQTADGGPRADTEHQLRPGPDRYQLPGGVDLPPGTRLGETDNGPLGGSPLAPDTGANTEPFPVGSAPIEGKPERDDGLDGDLRDLVQASCTPITVGRDAIGLLP